MTTSSSLDDRHRRLVIMGAGGHATSVASVALAAGYRLEAFVDSSRAGEAHLGFDVIARLDDVAGLEDCAVVIAVGDNDVRHRIFAELGAQYPSIRHATLVHPSAVVSAFATLGAGSVLMPNAVVGANSRVGKCCIVNTAACLDHDCVMDDFSSLAPRAVTGGGVRIGMRSAISMGAIVKNDVTVGEDSVVGANCFLDRNLAACKVAYGSVSREDRNRVPGEPYLS